MDREPKVIWQPQPGPQAALTTCPVEEIFYGGARGGGKTDGMIGKNAIKAERYGKGQKGIFFRRELPQLEAAIERTKEIYIPLGWSWGEQKKTFVHPNGATLKFRSLERDSDAEKYQGHDYTDVYMEELPNYPDPAPVNKLRATLRSGKGIPCQLHGTGNPGGPGHQWVKARYIDPAPQGNVVIRETVGGRLTERVFIPAKVSDNRILMQSDPGYVTRLHQSGSAELVRAWLEGDWNVVEGAFFDCWTPDMVIKPFTIPDHWLRFRAFDWGYAAPFSVGWWAVVTDDYLHLGQRLPRGALVRYREWYGANAPNIGLRMTAENVAKGIKSREDEEITYSVADPAIFAEDGGPCIAERMEIPRDDSFSGLYWSKGDNKRVAREGSVGGWDAMRDRMVGTKTVTDTGQVLDDGDPMIFVFETCADSIRTIPSLPHDKNKAEDIDTNAEDHAADEWRYACMSRPWVKAQPRIETPNTDAWGRPRGETGSWKTN